MSQYAVLNIATQTIETVTWSPDADDFVGPVDLAPFMPPGCELRFFRGQFTMTPPTPTAKHRWGGASPVWREEGGIDDQRAYKADAISACCADAILAGFLSDALGAPHSYPAKPNDQANLTGSVVRSFYPNVDTDWRTPFWCADEAGAWAFRPHSAAQIQQVGDDAVAARLDCMNLNEQLQAQIAAAETPADLASITWPE